MRPNYETFIISCCIELSLLRENCFFMALPVIKHATFVVCLTLLNTPASNQTCYLCGMPDSIKHTFVDCPISNQLYNKIIKWFNEDNASSFYPSSLEILFGNFECSRANGLKVRKLNYTLLFSKYYIYCQKLNNNEF